MSDVTSFYLSVVINACVFVVTLAIVASYFYIPNKEGKIVGRRRLRFYTNLSNIFSALSCGVVLFIELRNCTLCGVPFPHWAILLKFMSTTCVTLTMLTVAFFLGPTQGYGTMYGGTGLFTHLIGPLLAIFSLCYLEGFDKISLEEALVAVVPTLIYALIYLRQVIFNQELDLEGRAIKGWEDFYGFSKVKGGWPVALVIMLLAITVISLVLRAVYNM